MADNRPNTPSENKNIDQNSYSKSGMVTFVLSMVASFGILIYVAFLSGGINLKELPQEKPAAVEGAPAVAPEDPNAPKAEGVQPGAENQAPVAAAPDANEPAASPTPDGADQKEAAEKEKEKAK